MINFARKTDIPEIMEFIDLHWKKGHILTRDREFFEYFYITKEDSVNFVISRNAKNLINGVLGFVHYDDERKNISLALWKALPEQDSFVGLELFDFLITELRPDIVATLGVNIDTSGEIYLLYDYVLGTMKHWYRLADLNNYRIAKVKDKVIPLVQSACVNSVKIISNADEIPENFVYDKNALPKNKKYLNRRYFKHPVYRYKAFLFDGSLIVITRKQLYQHSSCLRVVDILGDYNKIPQMTDYLDKYLLENGIEYMDIYNVGVSDEIFQKAGFMEVTENNIIPEHFAPYEPKNIDINYSSSKQDIILFKGDGDMDRPS